MTEIEAWWADYLGRVEIRGALPIAFSFVRVDGHPHVALDMEVLDVATGAPITLRRHHEMPPHIPRLAAALQYIERWAMGLYAHEISEQTYVGGVRRDVPDHEH